MNNKHYLVVGAIKGLLTYMKFSKQWRNLQTTATGISIDQCEDGTSISDLFPGEVHFILIAKLSILQIIRASKSWTISLSLGMS